MGYAASDPRFLLNTEDSDIVSTDPRFLEGYDISTAKNDAPLPRSAGDVVSDAAITATRAAIGLPEALVGLLDIPTRGAAGKYLQELGYDPKQAKEILDTWYSPAQQAANKKVHQADGFTDTLSAAIDNPSVIANTIVESAPLMVGGAAIGRGVAALGARPFVAGAVGEGTIAGGSAAEQIRQQTKDGRLTDKQATAAVAAGIGTGLIGAAGGKIAQRYGGADIDSELVQQSASAAAGLPAKVKSVGVSTASEGGEELLQSPQEQAWQNVALDRPVMEGTGNAAALGLLSGAGTGLATGSYNATFGKERAPTTEQAFANALLQHGITQPVFDGLPADVQFHMWQNQQQGRPVIEGVEDTLFPPSQPRPAQQQQPAAPQSTTEDRLAELEIAASERALTPAEQAELTALSAQMEQGDTGTIDAPEEQAQQEALDAIVDQFLATGDMQQLTNALGESGAMFVADQIAQDKSVLLADVREADRNGYAPANPRQPIRDTNGSTVLPAPGEQQEAPTTSVPVTNEQGGSELPAPQQQQTTNLSPKQQQDVAKIDNEIAALEEEKATRSQPVQKAIERQQQELAKQKDSIVAKDSAFTPTHELSDGTQVVAYEEDGKAVPDTWVDENGDILEDSYADPIAQTEAPKSKEPEQKPAKKPVRTSMEENVQMVNDAIAEQAEAISQFAKGMEPEQKQKPAKNKAPILQNRDRSSEASIKQMQAVAKAPDPDRLTMSRTLTDGAPVVIDDAPETAVLGRAEVVTSGTGTKYNTTYALVDATDILPSHNVDGMSLPDYAKGKKGKMRVVAGNGRAAGVKASMAKPDANTQKYIDGLKRDAAAVGIDPAAIDGMKRPMLVRMLDKDADITNIADESNIANNIELSVTERAINDASRLDLNELAFTEDGGVNRDTLMSFIQRMPENERSGMVDRNGEPNKAVVDRVNNAIFMQAYNSEELGRLYAEATNPVAKNILNAMARSAPDMIGMQVDAEIKPIVVEAAERVVSLANAGKPLKDFTTTGDMFSTVNDEVAVVMQFFADNNRSGKAMADKLQSMARYVNDNAKLAGTTDMFGTKHPGVTLQDALQHLTGKPAANTEAQPKDAPKDAPKSELTEEELKRQKADEDIADALSDLGAIFGKPFRASITPEQEQQLMPVLTRLMDAAFRKGYYKFKDAAKFIVDTIRAKLGDDVADQINLQHLQGAYIGMTGKYLNVANADPDKTVDGFAEVGAVTSIDQIMNYTQNEGSNKADSNVGQRVQTKSDSGIPGDNGRPDAGTRAKQADQQGDTGDVGAVRAGTLPGTAASRGADGGRNRNAEGVERGDSVKPGSENAVDGRDGTGVEGDSVLPVDGAGVRTGGATNDGDAGRGATGRGDTAERGDRRGTIQPGDGENTSRGELQQRSATEGVSGTDLAADQREVLQQLTDFTIDDPAAISGGGAVARFNKNKAAIELRNELLAEDRRPTKEEQAILAGYTGWGSFGQELFQGTWKRAAPKKGWEARDQWLRENLGQSEWEGLQRSIINAHYTDPPTVQAMWQMVERMGFTGGKVLEPSIGIGNFFGLMPKHLADKSSRTGIELDEVTGSMAQMLYPKANIQIKGYEKSKTPDNFYDLVIGNWPFADIVPADRRYQGINPQLHDYFFLKAVDQVRPGGIVIGITSAGTMDKKSPAARAALAKKAELVASFRLPSGAFEGYAGTSVVTDIIILRKRAEPIGLLDKEEWIYASDLPTKAGTPVRVNEYYHKHPENVIGTIDYGHGTTTFRPGMIVHRPEDMAEQLQRAVEMVPEGIFAASSNNEQIRYISNNTDTRVGTLVSKDGELYISQGEHMAEASSVKKWAVKSQKTTAERRDQLDSMVAMREGYAALIDAELNENKDPEPLRKSLAETYNRFVKKHGPVADSYGLAYLKSIKDPFAPAIAALEKIDAKGKSHPAEILERSILRRKRKITNPGIKDAFILARTESLSPTLQRIAELANQPEDKVKQELIKSGAVFELPNGDIVPHDVYLSGNVREKLRDAQSAMEEGNQAMAHNIAKLKEVIPADIPYYKIEAQLGATWVAPAFYEQYVASMLGMNDTNDIKVAYQRGKWTVTMPSYINSRAEANTGFGTKVFPFSKLVNNAIANTTVTIYSEDSDGNKFVNLEATREVNGKIADMRAKFAEWLWAEPERRIVAEQQYNEIRNAFATPKFDGSFLPMDGMALSLGNGEFNLRQHQQDAVYRGVLMRKSINAHEVGTGKTFTMAGIAIESRRYGVARKPMLLAHNANSKAVAADIQAMYPGAKVLYIDNLSKANMATEMYRIANEDWDAVVVPHSAISKFTLKEETLMALAQEAIDDYMAEAIAAAEEDGVSISQKMFDDETELRKLRSPTAKQLVKARMKLIESIKKQAEASSKEGAIAFEDLGVDMLLVDEAHEFKKPPLATKMRMKGLNTETSSKSLALNFLTSYVRKNNNGGNVHLFTGTPITNTLTEIFHQMRYVMQEDMAESYVADWDGWFGSFASEVDDIELTATGEYQQVIRLASFVNVPELRQLVGQYMDVVFADDMPEMRPRTVNGKTMKDDLTEAERAQLLNGRTENAEDRPYKKVVNENMDMHPEQEAIFSYVRQLAEEWQEMDGKAKREAMISGAPQSPIVYEGIAQRASLDARLADAAANAGKEGTPEMEPHPNSKPARAVQNILEIYNSHPKATQAVFMDSGVSKRAEKKVGPTGAKTVVKYDVFSTQFDMIERLVQAGIPREQIARIDGSTSKEKRKEIARKMNSGEIRIVFGSSAAMGVGVNMQKNLRAMHHLDAPWMPGLLEQRNGRGHRQGNQWNTVLEYRYLTDKLDGKRWQVLATKQKFITAFMRADANGSRVIEGDAAADEEGSILDTLAEAAGDPRMLIREKLKKKIDQLSSKKRMHEGSKLEAKRGVEANLSRQQSLQKTLDEAQASGVQETLTDLLAAQNEQFSLSIKNTNFDKRKDAADALRELKPFMRVGDRATKIGSYGSVDLFTKWNSLDAEPHLFIEIAGMKLESKGLSLPSLEAAIRKVRDTHIQEIQHNLTRTEETIANLKKIMAEPFFMQEQLDATTQKLKSLEEDLAANPVAPPYWLRNGAPVETEINWGGSTFTVSGHRWTADGWYVVADDANGKSVVIPYQEVQDASGMPLYDPVEFYPPEVSRAANQENKDSDPKFSRADNAEQSTKLPRAKNQRDAMILNAELMNYGLGDEYANAYETVTMRDDVSAIAGAIASAFGKRVVGVQPTADKFNLFNGFQTDQNEDAIYVNTAGNVQFINVAGHELLHSLKRDRPGLYEWYLNHARNYFTNFGEYADKLRKLQSDREKPLNESQVEEELIADFTGDALADPAFLSQLAEDNPTKFKALLDAVVRFLNGVMHKLRGNKSEQYVSDVDALRSYLRQVMDAYVNGTDMAAVETPTLSDSMVGPLQFSHTDRTVVPIQLSLRGWSGSASELSRLAREVYTEELQGKNPEYNSSLGAEIHFTAEGKGEAFGAKGKLRNPIRAEIVTALRDIVRNSVKITESLPDDRRKRDTKIFHTLVHAIKTDGGLYGVKVTVREALFTPDGKNHKFYDVSSLEIKKETNVNGLGTSVHPSPVDLSTVTIGDIATLFNIRDDNSLRFSHAPQPVRNAWQKLKQKANDVLNPETTDNWQYELQDKYVDLKKLRDHIKRVGGTITDLNDAYLGEELYHKRLAKRTEKFLQDELRPLLEGLHEAKITVEDFEKYLHARHAPEANAVMAERNLNEATINRKLADATMELNRLVNERNIDRKKGFSVVALNNTIRNQEEEVAYWKKAQPFRGTEAERMSLSGMSNTEAQQVIDAVPANKVATYEQLATMVDQINNRTLNEMNRYGLLDSKTVRDWKDMYNHYVPLHRDEAHPDSNSHPIGSGFSTKGRGIRSRVGSNSKVTNILAHIAMQRESALTRGEKNMVMKKLYLMAAQNPDQDYWSIEKVPTLSSYDPVSGLVRRYPDPLYAQRDNVLVVRINGKDVPIVFNENNPQAKRLAAAMKNLDVDDLHYMIPFIGKGTRWLASVNTQYNPIFGIVNFTRDVQTAMLNLSNTEIAGHQGEVFMDTMAIFKQIVANKGRMPTTGQWGELFEDLQATGGTTGYRDLFLDPKKRSKEIESELQRLNRGQIKKALHAVVDWLSDYNEALEGATRLAAYKVALENGLSKQRAASVAKNLTVNFNRKGRQTRELGSLYAFFNASVQGTVRMVGALNGPAGRKIMAGGVGLGVLQVMLGIAAMGGDEWDKIPAFVKERNMIIPVTGSEYITIPMPLGFHFLPNIGRIVTEKALGVTDTSVAKSMVDMAAILADAFNPLGSSTALQMVAPTVVDPLVALTSNTDWTGKKIYMEDYNQLDPSPGHSRAMSSATPWSKAMAQFANWATGGNEDVPGAISPTPDQIDYLIGQLTGGIGREAGKLATTAAAPFNDDELPPYKIPLVGRFFGTTSGTAGQSEKFYDNIRRSNIIENELYGNQARGTIGDYIRENPRAVEAAMLGNDAERIVKKLRKERRAAKEAGLSAVVKQRNDDISQVMSLYNTRVTEMRRQSATP